MCISSEISFLVLSQRREMLMAAGICTTSCNIIKQLPRQLELYWGVVEDIKQRPSISSPFQEFLGDSGKLFGTRTLRYECMSKADGCCVFSEVVVGWQLYPLGVTLSQSAPISGAEKRSI